MSKKMLINATHPEEHRVAIVEDGILSELDIEITGKEQTKGNIYKAVVVRVETGLQAAFVDYGGERPGFLQIGEVHPSFHKPDPNSEKKGRPRINDLLQRGQELLVQVVKEERGTKGAALTTYLSLPGRYMVLMPESDSKGISRKIEQESTRKKLKQTMNSMELPDNIGYIVRTAGIGQKKAELKRDVDYLLRVYEKILELGKRVKAPAQVYKESNLVIRSIRDYFSPDIDEVLVDDPKAAQEGKDFFQEVMPEYAQLVKLHQERRPIFSRYQIEEQIDALTRNKVPLPSGGSIVIDTTEALVAIDVNSGKMATEKGVEATAFKSNMEAAAETARQLRLRDLGGLIVIDFIDMRDRKHIREVEKCLKEALKNDKARVSVGRISQFGLLEMSRQRIKAALAEASYLPCPHCDGSGRVKSAEAQALTFLRRLSAGMAKGQIGRVEAELPIDVAAYLLNNKRAELVKTERQYHATIYIKGHPDFVDGQLEVEFIRREKEERKAAEQYVEASAVRVDSPPQEEPDQEPGEEEQAAQPEQEEGSRSGSRRRRRPRRRRKPAAATADQTSDAAGEASAETTGQADTSPSATAATEVSSAATGDTAPQSDVTPPSAEQPQPGQEKPAEPSVEPTAATVPAAAPDKEEAKPKPKPRRRKPAAVKAQAAATETTADADGAQPAEAAKPALETATTAEPEAEKPKAKTPRRRKPAAAKKPATSEQVPADYSDSGDNQSPVAEPAAAAEPVAATEPGAVTAAEPKEEAPKAKAPRKRKPAAAKKPAADAKTATASAADQPAAAETAAASDQQDAAEKTDDKPKRRRTRKPAAKKPAAKETAQPLATESAGKGQEPDAAEAEKKPARRGRPRKKAAPADGPATAADKDQAQSSTGSNAAAKKDQGDGPKSPE